MKAAIELGPDDVNMLLVALGQLRVLLSRPQYRIDGSELTMADIAVTISRTYELENRLRDAFEKSGSEAA